MTITKYLQHFALALFTLSSVISYGQDGDIDAKMQKLAVQLSERIRAAGKNRVGVADFNDLQSNVPELGKFLAENLQGELVNNQLRIINRQRIEQLLIENKLTAQKLLDPSNALTIGKAAGMEVIVTGTITPIDERILAINVLALDVQGAVAIASAKTTIARTPSVNVLLRTVVSQKPLIDTGSNTSAYNGKDPDYEEDIPKNRCEDGSWGYGMTCFDNRHNKPLLLYKITAPGLMDKETNVLIAPGSEGCSPLILTASSQFVERTFLFKAVGSTEEFGFMTLSVGRCKARHITLTPSNFHLTKEKTER